MKLTRSTFLLLAAALLVAGVGLWYAFGRKKTTTAKPSPSVPVPGGVPGDSLTTPSPAPDSVTVPGDEWEGGEDDTDDPIRVSATAFWGPQPGFLRIGSASNEGMLNLVLANGRLENGRGQVINTAYVSPNVRYRIDSIGPWLETINGLWFGLDWPHTIEAWEVDPNAHPDTWRVNGTPHAQTVFTLKLAQGNYAS